VIASLLGAALAVAPILAPPPAAPPPLPPPPAMEEVFAIPPALRRAMHEQVRATDGRPDHQRLEALVRYLFDSRGLGMVYRHDADHTVAEAWQTREANCLSFTILTIALARELGIEAYGQEVPRVLSWYREGDTLYFSNHVNAGAHIAGRRLTVDVARDEVLTAAPPRQVDDRRLLAIFHSNRAATLLARGDNRLAAGYMDAAFAADDRYATAWSNAGVLAQREGRQDAAERDFQRALELDGAHEGALMNLAGLYAARGEHDREARVRRRIERIQRHNPFHHFLLAAEDEKRGDYARAAQRYRRAISLYAGEHQFHYGLARAYLHLGEGQKAGESLRRAQALAGRGTAQRYQAKLDQLRRKGAL